MQASRADSETSGAANGRVGSHTELMEMLAVLHAKNQMAVELAEWVEQRAEWDQVQRLAGRVARDHRELQSGLMEMAQTRGFDLGLETSDAARAREKGREVQERLRASGAEGLDHRFVMEMIREHRGEIREVGEFQRAVDDEPTSIFLAHLLAVLQVHLDLAEQLHEAGY